MPKTATVCPSVSSEKNVMALTTEPCSGAACWMNVAGRCSAARDTSDAYRRHFGKAGTIPECPISGSCMWNRESLQLGDAACAPRMLGLVCEHQVNDSNVSFAIWNTFDICGPDEDVWEEQRLAN